MAKVGQNDKGPNKSIQSQRSWAEDQQPDKNATGDLMLKRSQIQESSSRNKLLSSKIFTWCDQFQSDLVVAVIKLNYESMVALLHYGNFQQKITVLFTNLDEKLFDCEDQEKGAFGTVRFYEFEDQHYAIKQVKITQKNNQIQIQNIYKQYFLCSIGSILEVGPKMIRLFEYDIIISKNAALFSMEQCSGVRGNCRLINNELFWNLKKLHQIRIIHHDIKPANIAYSPLLRKHVFIDFGLSKIIRQVPGQKTRVNFCGTISFCSEQMRKSYILNKSMFVDLYQNDLCGLEKSMSRFQRHQTNNFNWAISAKQNNYSNSIESLALVLRLKFYLENQDCDGVLKILKNSKNVIKTVYQIFINQPIPSSLAQNQEIHQIIRQINKSIYNSKDQSSKTIDDILCVAFSQENQRVSAQKLLPISQLLQLPPRELQVVLTKKQMVYKLFLFFDPFSQNNSIEKGKYNLKELLVLKIYKTLNKNNSKEPTFFCQKLRQVLIFFYENLNEQGNWEVLLSLRMMFIAIEDWGFVEKAQDKILFLINKPTLKILKIAEFSMFWDVLHQDFEHKRKQKWKKLVQLMKVQQSSVIEQKVVKLFGLLMMEKKHFYESSQFKKFVMRKIFEMSQELSEAEEKQSIKAIIYIYSQLSKIHFSLFSCPPYGLTLAIYTRFFDFLKAKMDTSYQKEYELLSSLRFQLMRGNFMKLSKNLTIKAIQYQFQIFKEASQYINTQLLDHVYTGFVDKECLLVFGLKLKQFISNNVLELSTNKQSIFNQLSLIHAFLALIKFHKQPFHQYEKATNQEIKNLLRQISQILQKVIKNQRFDQFFETSEQLKIYSMIIQAEIGFHRQKDPDSIKLYLQQIFQLLNPLPHKNFNLMIRFTFLFEHLGPYLHMKQHHYSKDMLVHIAESYIVQKHFYIFDKVRMMLGDYIRLKNQMGETGHLPLILQLIQHFSSEKQLYGRGNYTKALIYGIQIFCRTLTPDKLSQVYEKIKFNCLEKAYGFYGYFVFQVFLINEKNLDLESKRKQIPRTVMCLQKMQQMCLRKTQQDLLRISKEMSGHSRQRKKFICSRFEGKIFDSEIPKKIKIKPEKGTKKAHKWPFNFLTLSYKNTIYKLPTKQ